MHAHIHLLFWFSPLNQLSIKQTVTGIPMKMARKAITIAISLLFVKNDFSTTKMSEFVFCVIHPCKIKQSNELFYEIRFKYLLWKTNFLLNTFGCISFLMDCSRCSDISARTLSWMASPCNFSGVVPYWNFKCLQAFFS